MSDFDITRPMAMARKVQLAEGVSDLRATERCLVDGRKGGTLDVVSDLGAGWIAESPNESNGSKLRYRLDVLAPSVLDTVQLVGGWLFDHALAGWEVTVVLINHEDPRPLKILGADVVRPEVGLEPWTRRAPAQLLALAGDLLDRDDVRLGEHVSPALRRGLTQVAVWDDRRAPTRDRSLYEVRHELSSAARAFKYHALAAMGDSEPLSVGRTEIFGYSSAGCSLAGLRQRRRGLRALCE